MSRQPRASASPAPAAGVADVQQGTPGKVTRAEHGASSGPQGTARATSAAGPGGRAGDWPADQTLLTALGLGELGQGEAAVAEQERHGAALVAASQDLEARRRDPVVQYLEIHSNSAAHAVAAMLQAHQEEWPAPGAELTWGDAARFTGKLVRTLCPVVRGDSFALFALVHPQRPDDAYRRHVAGVKAVRTTWIPGFGEAVAAQLKAALFSSIERVGGRFQAAARTGDGSPPAASQIVTSHPLDTYVRGAMAAEGVLDFSTVWRSEPAGAAAARPRPPGAARATVTVQWLGRQDAALWNYVRVSPPGATAEEVAAALYGSPAQSRMAFALQRHGDLFQVAPRQARALIAARYPGEVIGHGTARDGAALARSPLSDGLALREAGAAGAAGDASSAIGDAPSLPRLLALHFAILRQLEALRAEVAPLGLAGKLEPAFAFRERAVHEVGAADERARKAWGQVWHHQHVHLMMIGAQVAPLVAQARATTTSSSQRAAGRERIGKYLAAAAISHLDSSCAALLAELAAAGRQDLLDQATDTQIDLRNAMRQARAIEQPAERGSADADAALTHAQAQVLRGGDPAQLTASQLEAQEVALRTRVQTVRLALAELQRAADEAGAGLAAELARAGSGKFRRLPALIDAIQLRVAEVEHVWASAERQAPRPAVVADERAAERAELAVRAQGLDAAKQAFAKIAGDQDITTFLRESQAVVSSQQFRSGLAKLAGALAITVVSSGLAAELGAGLAGMVGAGEAGGATAGALAARAGGLVVNVAVNVTINSAVQYAMSEGHEALGWALVENTLMELATRGLAQVLKGPMAQLRALEQQALHEGQRLRQLGTLEREAGRRGQALADELVQEQQALRQARADRAGWFAAGLTVEVVLGMASQWAARSLLQAARGPGASVSDDFASNVLQQGAAVMLGKRLFGLRAAWQARRAELEAQPWFLTLPQARALVARRTAFFGEAEALAHSLSPEPGAGPGLLAQHESLVRLERELVAQGHAAGEHRSAREPGARSVEGLEVVPPLGSAEDLGPPGAAKADAGAPIGLFGDDTRIRAVARHLPPVPGYVDVFIHATANKLIVKRLDADIELPPRLFAAYLRKQGLGGMKLRLAGCSAGAHPEAVAQQLADAHGMAVLAPTKDLWVSPNGEHGLGNKVGEHTGRWVEFAPHTRETAPRQRAKEPRPLELERQLRESEVDLDVPEAVHAPRMDSRVRMSSASPEQLAAVRQAMRVPVVVDAAMIDGVRIVARREPRRIGFDLVVQEVHVGHDTLTVDVLSHQRTLAEVERYNGLLGNLRELQQRMLRSVAGWVSKGPGAAPQGAAAAALRDSRAAASGGRPQQEPAPRFPRGSLGWATELELRKLDDLLAARRTPLHDGAVDELTLREENEFLEGRRLVHEEVLRTIDDTTLHGATEVNLERPDTGEVTREALAQGYRLPGEAENASPAWYYYRNSTSLPGVYELARRPGAPTGAPGLRARVVGDTFTGFEPIEASRGVEIPAAMSAQDVIKHLRATPGFGEYLGMIEGQGLASVAVVDGVIQHKLDMLAIHGKRRTTEALRGEVREYFRERVTQHLSDPSLGEAASWQRFREMAAKLPPTERGALAEIWYRKRHTKAGKGQTRVEVARTSGLDEGKVQRRVVDAVEGDTAIEVKDIVGPIDRDQFGAYMDMLKSPGDGSEPLFKKVKYVFTNPEGAIANLEFMAGQMKYVDISTKLTVECFDSRGKKYVAISQEEAMRVLDLIRSHK